jgi:MFS family permease
MRGAFREFSVLCLQPPCCHRNLTALDITRIRFLWHGAGMATDRTIEFATPARKAGTWTIGAIFAGESLLRALNVSVIPIQAYELLGSSQRVSIVATAVSFAVLITTLSLPYVLHGVRRRWVYSTGIVLVMVAALLFASHTVSGQVLATYLRNVGASMLNITLSLYIMDNISKTELTKSEPVRMALSTISWVVGPATGTWLYSQYGAVVPQLVAFAAGFVLMAGFWFARLRDPVTLRPGTLDGFNPLSNLVAFFSRPRLRLAWSIAFGRSCFWSALFIYGPLLMLEGGLSKATAGLIISASQLTLPLSLIHGRLARVFGVRVVVAACFLGMCAMSLVAGLFGKAAVWPAVVCLLIASVCASGLDGVGAVPFYRAVKPRERQKMTSVYRTFFEFAELIPGFVFMLLLLHFEIGIVFIVIAGLSAFLCAITWKHLPKSM